MRGCPRCGLTYASGMEFCGLDGGLLIETNTDLLVGRTIGHYLIEANIGAGGVARIYRARHVELGSPSAIKVLLGEMACRPIIAERLRREAQAMSTIVHPNVVRTLDFGTTPQGVTYQVMELIEGRTLWQVIDEGPLSLERVRRIASDAARGLAAVHQRGFVHRDLKPSNIMLVDEEGRETAKLLDFGLVGATENKPDSRITEVGVLIGTPQYMAPELIESRPPSKSADLYSLGITIYEMIEGQPPFTGETVQEILTAHLTRSPPPLSKAGELEPLVMQMLAKRPADRPRSADDVLAHLERRPPKRVPLVPWAIAAAILMCFGLLLISDRETAPTQRATPAHRTQLVIASDVLMPLPDPPVKAIDPPPMTPAPKAKPQPPMAIKKRMPKPKADPVVAEVIEVLVDSDPPGAKVTLEGQGVLGRTPMTAVLRGARGAWLILENEQGEQRRVRWRPSTDQVKVRF